MKPNPQTLLIARPNMVHAARRVAGLRTALHDGNRKPSADLGDAANVRCDFFGLLGEWLAIDHLERAGLEPTDYELLRQFPKPGPDFVLNGVSYDAKAVPFGSRYLSCNERQRLDPRHACDYLLPVVFVGNNCAQLGQPIPYARVADWDLRQGHSPYRSVPVAWLKPLPDLCALPGYEALRRAA